MASTGTMDPIRLGAGSDISAMGGLVTTTMWVRLKSAGRLGALVFVVAERPGWSPPSCCCCCWSEATGGVGPAPLGVLDATGPVGCGGRSSETLLLGNRDRYSRRRSPVSLPVVWSVPAAWCVLARCEFDGEGRRVVLGEVHTWVVVTHSGV